MSELDQLDFQRLPVCIVIAPQPLLVKLVIINLKYIVPLLAEQMFVATICSCSVKIRLLQIQLS
jgi:hypothetical protein